MSRYRRGAGWPFYFRKGGENMGVRIRQKDGKWYVYINHHGKRKAKCVGDSKKAALEVKRKLEAKLTLGEIRILDETPQRVTFADFTQRWLVDYAPIAYKPSSQRVVNGIVQNHLLPYFGTKDLRNIARSDMSMREGEALGLVWDDVQFGQDVADPYRFIHVRRTYDPVHRMFNTPKNGRSRRVDMSQELREALLDLRDQRMDEALLTGTTTIPQVVFCGHNEQPIHPSVLYRIHKRVCESAGLRAIRVHDLRHSYATIQLYEHHAPIQYVSEQLGHASIKITVDIYGYPRQGTSISLADQLDSPRGTIRNLGATREIMDSE